MEVFVKKVESTTLHSHAAVFHGETEATHPTQGSSSVQGGDVRVASTV